MNCGCVTNGDEVFFSCPWADSLRAHVQHAAARFIGEPTQIHRRHYRIAGADLDQHLLQETQHENSA